MSTINETQLDADVLGRWLDSNEAPGSGEQMVAIAARQLHDLWLENDPEKVAAARARSHQVTW